MASIVLKYCLWKVSSFSLQFLLLLSFCSSESIRLANGDWRIWASNHQTVYFQTSNSVIYINVHFPACKKSGSTHVSLNHLLYSDPLRDYLGQHWSLGHLDNDAVYEFLLIENHILIRSGYLRMADIIGPVNKITKECFAEPMEMTFNGVYNLQSTRSAIETSRVTNSPTTPTTPSESPSQTTEVRKFTPISTESTSKTTFVTKKYAPIPKEATTTTTTRKPPREPSESNIVSQFMYFLAFILVNLSIVVSYRVYRRCQGKGAGNNNVPTTTRTTLFEDEPRQTTRLEVRSMSIFDNSSGGSFTPTAPQAPQGYYDLPPSYDNLQDNRPPPSYKEAVVLMSASL